MLYERYAKRRFQEGKQVGVIEGREVERNEWMAWLKRRDEANPSMPPPRLKASSKPVDFPH